MFKKIPLFLFLIFTSFLNAQIKTLSPEQMQQDFKIFKDALDGNYTSMYRFSDKQMIDKLFDETNSELNKPMSETEFLKKLIRIGAAFKDGHFRVSLSKDFKNYLNEEASLFPLLVYFKSSGVYAFAGTNGEIQPGNKIISINNIGIIDIQKSLLDYVCADGNSETCRYANLSRSFFYYYFLHFGESQNYEITFLNSKGLEEKEVLKGIKRKIIDSLSNLKEINSKLLTLEFTNDNKAILTIKTFSKRLLKESNENYTEFLKNSFKEITTRNVKGLIIDLRENGGGEDEYGAILFSYLAEKEFRYYDYLSTANNKITFAKYSDAPPNIDEELSAMVNYIGEKDFRLKEEGHPNLKIQKPSQNNYQGNVIVLAGRNTFSAAAEFCTVFHAQKRGKFAGEETGGTYEGNTSGPSLVLTLPNSKINVPMSLLKYVMACDKNEFQGRGILPEYPFEPEITDIISGNDTALNYALNLIN